MPCSCCGVREPGDEAGVERRGLVRVLAVAQHVGALPARPHPGGEDGVLLGREHAAHPRRDGDVVGRRVPESRGRQLLPLGQREAALAHGGQHLVVAGRVDDDGDRRVVLRRGTDHRRAADVDLLDALVGAGAGGDGLGERVEVHDDEVERRDPELLELRHVLGLAAVGEDAGVHRRVQRLHPAVQALREAGDLLDRCHGHPGVGDPPGGGARAHQLHAGGGQAAGQLLDAGLVVHTQQGPADGDAVAHR